MLQLLPNSTRGGTKDTLPTQFASAAAELAGLSAPFYASSSFGLKSEAAAKGLTVLFRNLFPPTTVTYQHTYVDSPTRFGWNFKQNKSKPEEASILGLHRGVVLLLQAHTDVKKIGIRYTALSAWPRKY